MRMSEAHADDDLFALATRLLDQAGLGGVQSLSRLEGGKNNQVYRVDPEAGAPLVLKRYFTDPRDSRDRLAGEWNFLDRAWSDGIDCNPVRRQLNRQVPSHHSHTALAHAVRREVREWQLFVH